MELQAAIAQVNPISRGTINPTPPKAIAALGNYTVYDRSIAGDLNVQNIILQNVGLGTVFVCFNDVATALKYNYILAADTGAEAGNGGILNIPGSWFLGKVSLYSTAGSTVAITKVVNQNPSRIVN